MPQLTSSFFKQGPKESLADVPRFGDGPKKVRFTHILHPYEGGAQNRAVQEVTFETIRAAIRVAGPNAQIRCVCVTLPGESHLAPPDFIAAAPLGRTVLDVGTFKQPRTLPLVFDVLDNGAAVPEDPPTLDGYEDYIIATNSDIHLQPSFYLAVTELVRAGYDVININRRTIPNHDATIAELSLMYGEYGGMHPGVDCFVFPRRLYTQFVHNDACVGILLVMRGLVFNMAAMGKRFLVLTSAHFTFHIGDDRQWTDPRFKDYEKHNMEQSRKVAIALAGDSRFGRRLVDYLRVTHAQLLLVRAAEDAAGIPATVRTGIYRRLRIIARRVAKRLGLLRR